MAQLNVLTDHEFATFVRRTAMERRMSMGKLLAEWASQAAGYTNPAALDALVESWWRLSPDEALADSWLTATADSDGVTRWGTAPSRRELCVDDLIRNTHLDRAGAEQVADSRDWSAREPWPSRPTPQAMEAERHRQYAIDDAVGMLSSGDTEQDVRDVLINPSKTRAAGMTTAEIDDILAEARAKVGT